MVNYKNLGGNSGITRYATTANGITIEFNHNTVYQYTYKSAGKKNIETMKQLAAAGKGLSTYISQVVKQKFEKKLQ